MDKSIDLKEVLRLHELWLKGYEDGRRADLSQGDFSYTDLSGADLSNANMRDADLSGADLSGADLSGADLSGAYLRGAYLRSTNLRSANLRDAYLRSAYLSGADLSGADLSYAAFDDRIFCLDRIGFNKRRTTYNATKDIVWCGCFTGTFEEWVAKIRKTYPGKNNVYRREYEAAIAFFKTVAEANEENAHKRKEEK